MSAHAWLELAHHHPGRLRVGSDLLRYGVADAAVHDRHTRVRSALDAMRGVSSVAFNTQSGSVLVEYEPGVVDPNALIDAVARAGGLELLRAELKPPRRRRAATSVIAAAREANAFASELTGGRADLRELVPLVMTGLAAYSFFVRKDPLPRWDNLAYWAYSIFHSLHGAEIARGEPHAG